MHVGILLGLFFFCVFCIMLFILLKKNSGNNVPDNPYEPKLFLRLRNNNTYFVDIRTYSSLEWHGGDLPYVSHTYNWEKVEAGISQEEADKVMAGILEKLRAEKALKESLEYKTVKIKRL